MKLIQKGQRGFTLIEVLIVIGLTGLIVGGLTTTIMQVMTMSHRTANRMTAVRQVQQAGFWVSPDVQMAQGVVTGGSPGVLLTLNWTEIVGATNSYKVIYTLEDMSGGLKKLWRKHYTNSVLDSTIKVAEYIDPAGTNCDWDDVNKILTFKVTATVGGQSETKTYRIMPRPGS